MIDKGKEVLVLMSCYNGEKFIEKQIQSILEQIDISSRILIRDDGSKDHTCDIVEAYASKDDRIEFTKGHNVGFVESFNQLIGMATAATPVDYYAFVDQDDIWLPQKLSEACRVLSKFDNKVPNLFCSNSELINSKGDKLGIYKTKRPHYSKGNILIFPTVQGCSMVFNRKAAELYNMHHPKITYHDKWMFFICKYLGNVYYEHKPMFLYRIHSNNALGLTNKGLSAFWSRLKKLVTCQQNERNNLMINEFYGFYEAMLDESDKRIIYTYLQYKLSLKFKLRLIFNKEYTCPNNKLSDNILRIIHIFQNRL